MSSSFEPHPPCSKPRPVRRAARWARVLLVTLGFTAVSLVPHGASGQKPAPGSQSAAADALFSAGRADLSAGRLDAACAKFTDSLGLDRTIGTILNLASCEARRGRLASSWSLWREALEILPQGDARIAFATQQLSLLEPRLPRLTLRLDAHVSSDIRISRNGVEIGRAAMNLAIPIDPGQHSVHVNAPGYDARVYSFMAEEGRSESLVLKLGPKKKPALAAKPSARALNAHQDRSVVLPWATLGVGGVGLGTAIVTSLQLSHVRSTVERACDPASKLCSREGLDAVERGKALLPINTAAFGVAALGLTGGLYWLLSVSNADAARRRPEVALTLTKQAVTVGYAKAF